MNTRTAVYMGAAALSCASAFAADVPVTVELSQPVTQCRVTRVDPFLISASPGDRIVWNITNNCKDEAKKNVKIGDIKLVANGTKKDPLDPCKRDSDVAQNSKGSITCPVSALASVGQYKYDLHYGKIKLDPEIEVRP